MNESFDCIVIGGGPAGSTVAALVAEAGFRVLLLEREAIPRYHIGESMMPETYWTLQRLGVLDLMKQSRFVKKCSVQFVSHTGRESQPFYFFEYDEHESARTWQVVRSEFDQMLWDNAVKKGADGRTSHRVLDVLFEESSCGARRALGVRLPRSDSSTQNIEGRVIVDATGQQSLVSTKLGIRQTYPDLRKAAIWGYYRGARRDHGVDEGATIILHTRDRRAWFWYIPLQDNMVSVGVVSDTDELFGGRGKPESIFEQKLAQCPAVAERLHNAQLEGELNVAREFSYRSKQPAGDGWVLVGDALGFLDPIYSSGIFLALKSAEMAADAIIAGLHSRDTSEKMLSRWTPEFFEGMQWIEKLVRAFYTEGFSFGRFIKQHPQHQQNLTDLLVGKIFRPGIGEIFNEMDPWLEKLRAGSDPMESSSKE